MYWDELKTFFKKYPNLKEKKKGLYGLLLHPYLREKYKVSIEEAECLVGVELTEGEPDSPLAWARELIRLREREEVMLKDGKQ